MKLGYYLADQHVHKDRSIGITEYSISLARELCKRSQVDVFQVISKSSIKLENADLHSVKIPLRSEGSVGRILCDHLHGLKLPKLDLIHYPKGFIPAIKTKMPTVCTIHDTIIQHCIDHYPNTRSPFAFRYWLAMLLHSIRKADMIVTVSKHAKTQIQAVAERYKIKIPPIGVTYEGSRWEPVDICTKSIQKKDYVVAFASREPYKKTSWLIEAWKNIQKGRSDFPKLRLIGNLDNKSKELINGCKHIDYLGFLDENALKIQIQEARALLFPSEIEGFGLPAVEAYYLNTPAVFVKETAVDEILGYPSKCGFVLSSESSFIYAVTQALEMTPEEICQKSSELLELYAWKKVGKNTELAYKKCLQNS